MGIATRDREAGAGNTILLNLDITRFGDNARRDLTLHGNVVRKGRLLEHLDQARWRD